MLNYSKHMTGEWDSIAHHANKKEICISSRKIKMDTFTRGNKKSLESDVKFAKFG